MTLETLSIMLPEWLVTQYEDRAAAERAAGGSCQVDARMPTVTVMMSSGEEWFFQGEEASALLDSTPDNLSHEDYILASAQNW